MVSPDVYSTLPSVNSIRLLRLQSLVQDEPVSCSLIVVDQYASGPEYHALSYCWGDANDTVELICSGRPFQVTKTLYAALRRLREKVPSQLVWADAICINQEDVTERNQQLLIMKQIFLYASRIFVWIGPGDEHSVPALNLI
ncbi:HET-domain-containing protein, partial [Rhizodiscina lignyota]